jgi:hypothetical protein
LPPSNGRNPKPNQDGFPTLWTWKTREALMRKPLACLALTLTCLTGAPAIAQTIGAGPPVMVTVDDARDIAAFNGVVLIRKIEFDDGLWKIEGRDRADRRVEMRIDPRSGEVAELERFD